jgi:hypothetical protein
VKDVTADVQQLKDVSPTPRSVKKCSEINITFGIFKNKKGNAKKRHSINEKKIFFKFLYENNVFL